MFACAMPQAAANIRHNLTRAEVQRSAKSMIGKARARRPERQTIALIHSGRIQPLTR
jgi:hypothetical protein